MCTDTSNAIRPRICVKKVNRVNKKFKLSFIRAVKEQARVIVAALQSSWFGSTHGGFWSLVRLELACTHIGTVGSWSSRAHTARMNNPETRSDTHTGPLVHHRTHPGNPGLNTDSLGGRERNKNVGMFALPLSLGGTLCSGTLQLCARSTAVQQTDKHWCNNLHVFAQMSPAVVDYTKKTKMGRMGQLIWSGT